MDLLLVVVLVSAVLVSHALGRLVVAKLCGVRVDRFSIGFGPPLASFRRGGTTYQLTVVPLGGFVQVAGMNPTADPVPVDEERAIQRRPLILRVLVVLGGAFAVYVFAALLMVLIYVGWGVAVPGKMPIIGQVADGRPAKVAGLQMGDEIFSIQGKPVHDMNDVSALIDGGQGAPVTVVVIREVDQRTFSIKPERDASSGKWRIGITIWPKLARERQPVGRALVAGLIWPYDQTVLILRGWSDMVRGRQKAEFTGPVGIVKVMKGQIAKGVDHSLSAMAIISVYLGLFLLFAPAPASDGWRLVSLLRRRRSSGTDLGLLSPAPTTMPVALVVTLCISGLFVVAAAIHAIAGLVAGRAGQVEGVLTAAVISLVWIGLLRRAPRAWSVALNFSVFGTISSVLQVLAARDLESLVAALVVAALFLTIAALLATRRARDWFGLVCPACGRPRAHPVLSVARRRCCMACGSAWTAKDPSRSSGA